jgi:hypothetical protein
MTGAAIALLLTACASAPPPPPPSFTAVPATAVDAMCARINDEGMARETIVDLVTTTRPLVTEQSLQALLEEAFYQGRPERSAVDAAFAANRNLLEVPRTASCAWNAVPAGSHRADTMTLELSSPFVAPMKRGGAGLLARLSLGGEAATWYWIPLTNANGTWVAGRAMPLGMHE